jgi:hypothetical protein
MLSKMKTVLKISLGTIAVLLIAFIGWYVGYQQAITDQWYFDAPAKIVLLQKALGEDGTGDQEIINGMIFKQKCILSNKDYAKSFSVYHPASREMRLYYNSKIREVCGESGCTCIL